MYVIWLQEIGKAYNLSDILSFRAWLTENTESIKDKL